MECAHLVTRVANYLERHIAWFEECAGALDRLAEDLAADRLDEAVAAQQKRNARGEHLMREHRGLLAEWERSEDVSPADRRAVRSLAQRAEEHSETLSRKYDEAAALIDRDVAERHEAMNALRRGRQMVTRYRPDSERPANFIDRKA